jgi:hypothetical protein
MAAALDDLGSLEDLAEAVCESWKGVCQADNH